MAGAATDLRRLRTRHADRTGTTQMTEITDLSALDLSGRIADGRLTPSR